MTDESDAGVPGKIDARSPYRVEYVEQARKLAELGATDCQIGDFFEVSKKTINIWKLRHPDFAAAIRVGKEIPDERVVRSLYERAVGFTVIEQQAIKCDDWNAEGKKIHRVEVVDVEKHVLPDTTAAIFWLKNRQGWRDKVDVEAKVGLTVNISGADADL